MSTEDQKAREAFEEWYACNAFDYARDPIGSRDFGLQWKAWQAARATPSLNVEAVMKMVGQLIERQEEADNNAHLGTMAEYDASLLLRDAAREALRSALMSNAAPEVDRSAPEFTHDPALCIKPACPSTCSGCNHAISGQDARDYAIRYAWLRDRANSVREDAPQVVITDWSGSIISIQPWAYPQGATLDEAIDAFIRAPADPLQALHDNAQELGAKG